ncbi:glycosyltransferase family protein [Flexilinea flocculi]|uniref:Dolichyl-phosphate-mannose-protein mannosyltransferase n=1 Tax=Flexilinea flocculi TaxID=1678840 RepID=A0A0K8P9L0_9CHLR|nr:hypothetical protein [Flexilinea flocculi]GAP39184.1 dolichyl-phosphate-mannose-protein mannosyltransferase [Flexilinea flocculi]
MSIKLLNNKIVFYILVVFFAAVAVVVRVHDFGSYPADINCDESMSAVEAMALVDNGTDHLGTSYPVYFEAWGRAQQNALYPYLIAVLVKFLGINTVIVRLPMLIFSLLGIALLTLISGFVYSKNFSLIVLALTAINPWHIMQSRWGLESNIFPHFLLLGLFFLLYSLKSRKSVFLYISIIFYGLSLYGYGVAYAYIPFLLLSIFVILFFTEIFRSFTLLIATFLFFLVSWPILLMIPINYFKLPTFAFGPITMQLFEKTTRLSDFVFLSKDINDQFFNNVRYLWNIIMLQKMDVWWNQLPAIGTMYKISLPFSVIGIVKIAQLAMNKNEEGETNYRKICSAILLINLAASLFTGLIINNVNVTRMNHIYYPLILVTAYGIYWVFSKNHYFGIFISLSYGVYFSFFCYRYFYSEDRTFINYTYDQGLEKTLQQANSYQKELCISTHQYRNDFKITEINTLYLLKLPYSYYSGEMNEDELKSSSYGLPYQEKFHYFSELEAAIKTYDDQCVYVVNIRDREVFDKNRFIIKNEGYFSVAVPNSWIPVE